MTISEIMVKDVYVCRPSDSLNQAARLMWEHDCGCVPVLDDAGRVVGMVTDRDVCMAAYTQGKPLADLSVSESMNTEVHACLPADSAARAEELMRANLVRRLPVIGDDGRLVGIVSLNDLAREAMRPRKRRKKELTPAQIGETLASICVPRSQTGAAPAA